MGSDEGMGGVLVRPGHLSQNPIGYQPLHHGLELGIVQKSDGIVEGFALLL